MNMQNYLVTVYIPTHNRSSLLRKAIESVLNQTYKNLEIIVCDDASSDDTIDVIKDLKNKDPRILFISNETPMGACYSRNRCINIAHGYYITGLDDDDYFLPERIESFIIAAQRYNKCSFICSNLIFKGIYKENKWKARSGYITESQLSNKNLVGNQIFIKTEFMQEVGGFDVKFPAWQDYDLWFRLVKKLGPCYKLSKASYIMNIDSNRPRITTSNSAYLGYNTFVQAHINSLSKKNLKMLFFQDKINRNDKISLRELYHNFILTGVFYYLKQTIKFFLNKEKNYEN